MSRNFELLQRLDRERGLAQEPAEELTAAATAPARDMGGEPTAEDLSRLVLANAPAITPSGARAELNVDRMMREELVKLAQRLFLLPGAFRSVVFAGVDQENGCGRICAQVGEILDSQAPRSVCLVDCNFPSPSLHGYFGMENEGGITDAVLQSGPITDFAHRLRGANLWLVPAGHIGPEWPALVNSERMRIRLHELTELYDHVLVNAPPAAAYVDAMHLGKLVDGMVVVLQANATRREAARKLKQDMQAARVRLLGAVLNEREFALRGYTSGHAELTGHRARVVTAEWRTPLADIDRTAMTPPVGFNRLSLNLFYDHGAAWERGESPDYHRGIGLEIMGELQAIYLLGVQFRAGVARGLDETGETKLYLRAGRSF